MSAVEEWRDIKDYPGYQVSDLGRVRSTRKRKPGVIMNQYLKRDNSRSTNTEYLRVGLTDSDGVRKNKRVHRLVLEAFVGPPPSDKHLGSHIDGNSLNNPLTNLRWATQKENEADKAIHGTKLLGEKVNNAKLTSAAVKDIRAVEDWTPTVMKRFMADLGVCRSTINDVLSGRTWSHVK